jgi:hypothetical protein
LYHCIIVSELADIPYGTSSLYVVDPQNPLQLRKEVRSLNATEREEATVVQYLALGGHSRFTHLPPNKSPDRIMSAIHAGPGQLVFGYSNKQRCDVTLAFARDPVNEDPNIVPAMRLHFHNYHGWHWHYKGHMKDCPSTEAAYFEFDLTNETESMDSFRFAYAEALTRVRPQQVVFAYHRSFTCDWFHNKPIPSLSPITTTYATILELLVAERADTFYQPAPSRQQYLSKEVLVKDITDGKIDGFVTLRGGRENFHTSSEPGKRFGFCVQNYAPSMDQISDYTKQQISEFYGLPADGVKAFVEKSQARTLNSTTFHAEETISTAYLRWLMKERHFVDFDITHFLWYKFDQHPRDFIEPLLQRRHELKKEGNVAAAEAVKLIGNSDFG